MDYCDLGWTPEQLDRYLQEASADDLATLLPLIETQPQQSLARYCPFSPFPVQNILLTCPYSEVLFGGAAGGSKSIALLMDALQYVHVPGYAAIIFRLTLTSLKQPGGLIQRSHEWLDGTDAKWNGTDFRWTWPNGATLTFGYLAGSSENRRTRFGSSEYHYIGFEELTEFHRDNYTFMFSRLRAPKYLDVPLRVRATTNPGGVGHEWVRERFVTDEATRAISADDRTKRVFTRNDPDTGKIRAFIPARIEDNPAIDFEAYSASLHELPAVTRERLLRGDWTVCVDGRIKPEWFRWWQPNGRHYQLLEAGSHKPLRTIDSAQLEHQRFTIVDCAGSSEDMAKSARSGQASFSVISTFDYFPAANALIWIDMDRGRWEFPELLKRIKDSIKLHRSTWCGIEDEKTGRAAGQLLRADPMLQHIVKAVSHEGKDKLTRAAPLLTRAERGQLYLPIEAPWKRVAEAEMIAWTGHPDEHADIIDTVAYAAKRADWLKSNQPTPGCPLGR